MPMYGNTGISTLAAGAIAAIGDAVTSLTQTNGVLQTAVINGVTWSFSNDVNGRPLAAGVTLSGASSLAVTYSYTNGFQSASGNVQIGGAVKMTASQLSALITEVLAPNEPNTTGFRALVDDVVHTYFPTIRCGHQRMKMITAPTAPTVVAGSAGNLTGTYYWRITFLTASGETEGGTASSSLVLASQRAALSSIPVSADPAVTGRRIWRVAAGVTNLIMSLVGTIADNTTTTFEDNVADGSLGVRCPHRNTTGGVLFMQYGTAGQFPAVTVDPTTTSVGYKSNEGGTGYNISSLGVQQLASNTTGYNLCAFGNLALYANTTGYSNVAVGYQALFLNTTGYQNTAIGNTSLNACTSGHNNVGVGRAAGTGLTSGNNCVFIGQSAGVTITTGNNAICIGQLAGNNASQLASAANIVCIGQGAYAPRSNMAVLGDTSIAETQLRGQVYVNSGGYTAPDASAQLQVDSTTRGFMPPRMTTTQRDAIASPSPGLIIYNTTTGKQNVRGASAWEAVTSV